MIYLCGLDDALYYYLTELGDRGTHSLTIHMGYCLLREIHKLFIRIIGYWHLLSLQMILR